ncbi:hypothetical protein GCM10027446_05740 [Angustibacter peucedani]
MDGGWQGLRTWAASLEMHRRARLVRVLLLVTVAVGAVRVVLSQAQRAAFVQAYGESRHLDMTSFLGQEIAKREAPGHLNAALFSLLCALLVAVLVRPVTQGAPWARNAAVVLSAVAGLNTLAYIAVPAPWWDIAMALGVVALSAAVILLLWLSPVIGDPQERRDARLAGR